jgi:putative ABC transport system permease protein
MDALFGDLRYAVRSLRKNVGFAAVTVLTIALGIAGVTIMFGVVDGVLLRPLPVQEQERVVVAWRADLAAQFPHIPFSHPAFREISRHSRSFERIAAVDYSGSWPFTVQQRGATTLIKGGVVTGDFFGVLGVKPFLGRALRAEDDMPGGARVLAISHALWRQRFGSDSAIIGQTVDLWGVSYEIVGVIAPEFEYPAGAALWVPSAVIRPKWEEDHDYWNLDLVGRLKPGTTADQARAELNRINQQLEVTDPKSGRDYRVTIRPFAEMIVGHVKAEIWVLSCAAVLVLLISAVNVAGLLIIKGASRRHEYSIRFALGASRERLARQTVTEAAVMVLFGSGLALALAAVGLRGVGRLAALLPRAEQVHLNPRVLGFALGAALITAAVLALGPIVRLAQSDLRVQLAGRRVATAGPVRLPGGQLLVVAQVALALVLLTGAGLLVKSLSRLQFLDLGFNPERLTTVQLAVTAPSAELSPSVVRGMIERSVTQIKAEPGVLSATPVLVPAFSGNVGYDMGYTAEGQNRGQAATNPILNYEVVASDYFETLGILLLKGRVISQSDREGSLPVVVINQELARRVWPGEDAVGKRLKWGDLADPGPWRTVVGVVGNTRYRELAALRPTAYVPYRQAEQLPVHIIVRSGFAAQNIVPALRHALSQANLGTSIVNAVTMTELLSIPLARPRFVAVVLSLFAALALLLAVLGLYGVIAFLVVQRTREIGVRLALGAQPLAVRWLVLRQAFILTVAGAVIGLAVSLAATRLLASILYEISPTDALTLVGAAATLLLISILASYLPAHRASRVDPIVALGAE